MRPPVFGEMVITINNNKNNNNNNNDNIYIIEILLYVRNVCLYIYICVCFDDMLSLLLPSGLMLPALVRASELMLSLLSS